MHIPHLLLSSGIVERTNGLLKHVLKPQNSRWPAQLSDAIAKVSSCWGVNGCPRLTTLCPKPPFLLLGKRETKDPIKPLHRARQCVLVDLPMVGEVPLTLKTPLNLFVCIATNAHGRDHQINTRWIVPSF